MLNRLGYTRQPVFLSSRSWSPSDCHQKLATVSILFLDYNSGCTECVKGVKLWTHATIVGRLPTILISLHPNEMSFVALSFYCLIFGSVLVFAADPIPIVVPTSPSSSHVVQQNFLGISFELSFLDVYCELALYRSIPPWALYVVGTDTSSIPKPILNYLAAVRSRTGSHPARIRIGGNSLDTSTYVPTQGSPMIQRQAPVNSDNQPARYGPLVWDVLSKVASNIDGVAYIIGPLVSPRHPSK